MSCTCVEGRQLHHRDVGQAGAERKQQRIKGMKYEGMAFAQDACCNDDGGVDDDDDVFKMKRLLLPCVQQEADLSRLPGPVRCTLCGQDEIVRLLCVTHRASLSSQKPWWSCKRMPCMPMC